MKRPVTGAAPQAGLVTLVVAATALATPSVGVQGTNLGVGAFESLEAVWKPGDVCGP